MTCLELQSARRRVYVLQFAKIVIMNWMQYHKTSYDHVLLTASLCHYARAPGCPLMLETRLIDCRLVRLRVAERVGDGVRHGDGRGHGGRSGHVGHLRRTLAWRSVELGADT